MNKLYHVRVEFGRAERLGSNTSIPAGTFDTFEEAREAADRILAKPVVGRGFRSVTIAMRNQEGAYNNGPCSLNAVYRIVDTEEAQC